MVRTTHISAHLLTTTTTTKSTRIPQVPKELLVQDLHSSRAFCAPLPLLFKGSSLVQHVTRVLVHVELSKCDCLQVKGGRPVGVDALCLHCIPEGGIWLVTHEVAEAPPCKYRRGNHNSDIYKLQEMGGGQAWMNTRLNLVKKHFNFYLADTLICGQVPQSNSLSPF